MRMSESNLETSTGPKMVECQSRTVADPTEIDEKKADGEIFEDGEAEDSDCEKGPLKESEGFCQNTKTSNSSSPRKRHSHTDHRKHHRHSHHHSINESSRKQRRSHSGEESDDRARKSRRRSEGSRSSRGNVGSSRHHDKSDRRTSHKESREESVKDENHTEISNISSSIKRPNSGRMEQKESVDPAEAEDGEILEDGELSDDGEDGDLPNPSSDTSREELREASMSSSQKDSRKDSSSRNQKERRKEDDKDKTHAKKYEEKKKMGQDGESNQAAPAWGSGYQGAKLSPQTSLLSQPQPNQSPYGKQGKESRSNRDRSSPPGLYDSPSYSDNSDTEESPKPQDGFMDSSVAGDEKEGAYKRGLPPKRRRRNRPHPARKRKSDYGRNDGPPAKKAIQERPVCKFFRDGKCAKGSGCTFNHDVEQSQRMEVCKYHLTQKGCHKEKCLYMHEEFPCKYYHTGAQCYSGDRCKFSHDPLTDETRRALEMRVAAEDIIDIEEDYDYDYDDGPRGYDSRSRPSLLGSPPRRSADNGRIPSLFDIETRPPLKSSKTSPQPTRPSPGFHREANQSPHAGSGGGTGEGASPNSVSPSNTNNPIALNPNAAMQSPSSNSMGQLGRGGSLPHPGSMNVSPMAGNGPGLLHPPGGPALLAGCNRLPFGNSGGGGNPSGPNHPVLNMLGAIIGNAGPAALMNAMASSMNNLSNQMASGLNSGNNPMGNMLAANAVGMLRMAQQANSNNNSNPMGPGPMQRLNAMNVPPTVRNMNRNNPNNAAMGHNAGGEEIHSGGGLLQNQESMDLDGHGKSEMTDGKESAEESEHQEENEGLGKAEDEKEALMENDKEAEIGTLEDSNQELSRLDQLRRRIQEQIDNDSEGEDDNEDEEEGKLSVDIATEGDSTPQKSEPENSEKEVQENKTLPESLLSSIIVPPDLPLKQRELYMRIQQQNLMKEMNKEQQDSLNVEEQTDCKDDKDDWYSDSEDESGEATSKKAKTTPLSQTSPKPSSPSLPPPVTLSSLLTSMDTSAAAAGKGSNETTTSSSTINIMQMINSIRQKTSVSAPSSTKAPSPKPHDHCEVTSPLPPLPPSSPPMSQQASEIPTAASLHLRPLAVDPPIVSSTPKKTLVYAVVKISLDLPKIYTSLSAGVNPSDPKYRHDPRIKRHIQHLEKMSQSLPPPPKEKEPVAQKPNSEEKDKQTSKPVDPRLNKTRFVGDPRLAAKQGSSVQAEGDPRGDPRLMKKDQSQQPQPPKAVDPRLARRNMGKQMTPDMSGKDNSMIIGTNSGPMGNMGVPRNQMGGLSMNNMANGAAMGSIGVQGMFSQGGGSMRMSGSGGPPMTGHQGNMMSGLPRHAMGGPQGNIMGGPQGIMMGGPQGNMMGGPQGNMIGVPQNRGGQFGNNVMGGPQGNMMGEQQGNFMMAGPQFNNRMNNPQMMGGIQGMIRSSLGHVAGPQGNDMMGDSQLMTGFQGQMKGLNGNIRGIGNQSQRATGGLDASPRGFSSPDNSEMQNNEQRTNNNASANDPRKVSRSLSDPRGTDPRRRNRTDVQDKGLTGGTNSATGGSAPAIKDPRDSRMGVASDPRSRKPNPSDLPNQPLQDSLPQQSRLSPLPSLSSSATLPPLPSLSPPPSSSSSFSPSHLVSPQPLSANESDSSKPSKTFDYRNDPRFKRVKRSVAPRKSSIDDIPPDQGERGPKHEEEVSSLPDNGYNRPKPSLSPANFSHRQNTPSPSLPDTLQDFDDPEPTHALNTR